MAQLAAWLLLGLLTSSQALSGGFGAPKAAKRKKKRRREPAAAPAPPPPPPPRAKPPAKAGAVDELASLMALQSSRAAYESRIAERCAHIDLEPGVEGGLAVIDDLLGPEACPVVSQELSVLIFIISQHEVELADVPIHNHFPFLRELRVDVPA